MFDETLLAHAQMTVERFGEAGATLVSAESCTGGLIGAALTSIAGASAMFDRGLITYSNQAKIDLLGVEPATLEAHGAVSMPVALEMATGARQRSGTNAAVAVTGIAGPGGGSEEKPVGLVYIAVANDFEEGAFGEEFRFGALDRQEIRKQSVLMALEMVLAYGLEVPEN